MKSNVILTNETRLPVAALLPIVMLTSVTILVGIILASSTVFADNDSVVDEVNITVPVSCTMSGTGMNTHNAEINNGTYVGSVETDAGTGETIAYGIGRTNVHAFCNDNEGFAIYAAGYTGNEVGGANSNKLVGTAASNYATIATGTAVGPVGGNDISNWAMAITPVSDSGDTSPTNAFTIDSDASGSFSMFHAVPNEYTKVAHKNSATDMTETTGGIKFDTTYAAYISKIQPADTYSGQVIYTLVHPSSHAAPVALNPNADDISEVKYLQDFAVVNSDNRNSIIASMVPEQQYTIKDSRDNKTYTIAKFNTLSKNTSAEFMAYYNSCKTECSDSLYNNLSDEWKIVADSCNVTVPKTGGDNIVLCDESLIPLHETTDVWMTKNLDLDIDSNRTYTNEDTDLGYNTTTNEYTTASWKPARSTYAATTTQTHEWCQGGTWNSQDGYCELNDTPESYSPGDLYWNLTESGWSDWDDYYDSCDYTTSTPTCDQSKNPISTYVSSTGTEQYHLGNYYNWAAALATNDSSVFNSSTLVEQSICPAGWTLPRIGEGEDSFYALWNQYGFASSSYNDANGNGTHDASENALWTSPLYFAAGGVFYGTLDYVGGGGYFWSPVPDGSGGAWYAGFGVDGYVGPSANDYRLLGNSVRCILRPVVSSGYSDGHEIIADPCGIDPTLPACAGHEIIADPCEIDPTLPVCQAEWQP